MEAAPDLDPFALSDDEIATLDGAEQDRVLWLLEQHDRRSEAIRAKVIARAEASLQFTRDGHRTVKNWVMAVTNTTPGIANRRTQTARLVRSWPQLGEELSEARIGVPQVHELARLGANPRCGDLLPESGGVLVQAAKDLQYLDFKIACDRWEQLADSDGAHRSHDASLEHRDVRITESGGEFRIEGRLPAMHGTIVRDILEHFTQAQFHADADAAKASGDPKNLLRTAGQRRADAFVAMAETAATAGIAGRPVDIVVNLVSDQDQFEQYLRNGLNDTPIEIDPATVMDRRSETADGVQVDPRTLVALALLGHVRRVVLDSQGILVNAGRTRRTFDKKIASILKTLDPRCRWLGCAIRAAISQLDHAAGYTNGGPTDAANGQILCEWHNLFKHRNGYIAVRNHAGHWHLHRPNGERIAPPDAA